MDTGRSTMATGPTVTPTVGTVTITTITTTASGRTASAELPSTLPSCAAPPPWSLPYMPDGRVFPIATPGRRHEQDKSPDRRGTRALHGGLCRNRLLSD